MTRELLEYLQKVRKEKLTLLAEQHANTLRNYHLTYLIRDLAWNEERIRRKICDIMLPIEYLARRGGSSCASDVHKRAIECENRTMDMLGFVGDLMATIENYSEEELVEACREIEKWKFR